MTKMPVPPARGKSAGPVHSAVGSGRSWSNWDRRQSCVPAERRQPGSKAELSAALERAAEAEMQVRVAGSGHSFTALVPTGGMLLDIGRMNRVLDVDLEAGLIRVEAGITLHELNATLDHLGRALENLGDIDRQTIAGATATGTHGTGAGLRNLSSMIHEVELMLADGSTVSLSAESDPDGWRAARVSLGALGVVTAITLQTVPSFRLRGVDGPASFDDTLARLDEHLAAHDHFEFYWFPYTTTALLRRNDRTDAPPTSLNRLRVVPTGGAHLGSILLAP
jgi:L-gulonolactone oxidase